MGEKCEGDKGRKITKEKNKKGKGLR